MVVSVFIAQGGEWDCDTPADLLIGWGKKALRIYLLVKWGAYKAPIEEGERVGHISFLVGVGSRRPGYSKVGRGHYIAIGGMLVRV